MTAEFRERALDIDDPTAPVVSERTGDKTGGLNKSLSADMARDGMPRDDTARAGAAQGDRGLHDDVELVPLETRRDFESRWREIQSMFVDDPRAAVDQANGLVAEVAQALTASFSQRKAALEQHAGAGGELETEELRQALRSYRALFERVLRI